MTLEISSVIIKMCVIGYYLLGAYIQHSGNHVEKEDTAMEKPTKKEMLLDATMRIVAQGGLSSFSMRQVTKAIGVSEALIYRHYETKENLLFQCFRSVDYQIDALFFAENMPCLSSEQELYTYIKALWMKYYSFLIQNDYKTLFYFEYWEALHLPAAQMQGEHGVETDSVGFTRVFDRIEKEYHISDRVGVEYFWMYILDVTGLFAKRVIRGEMPGDEQSCENVWRLIYAGVSGLL